MYTAGWTHMKLTRRINLVLEGFFGLNIDCLEGRLL